MARPKYLILIRFAASVLFAAISCAPFFGTASAGNASVEDVRLGINDGKTRVVLDLTDGVPYSAFLLDNPHRLVIDLPELDWAVDEDVREKGRGAVAGMRYGLFRAGNSRVVVDLTGPVRIVTHAALAKPDRIMFDLLPVKQNDYEPGQTVALNNWKPPKAKAIAVARATPPGDTRRIVIIDPGHGGVDPGAIRGKIQEKRVVMAVAEEVRRQLLSSKRYRVVMTRERDIFVELRDRVKIAQEHQGDIFISIHADTHPKRETRGASIYTLSERASDKEAARLAAKENKVDIVGGLDLASYSPDTGNILLDLTRRRTMEESSIFAGMLMSQFRNNKIGMQPIKTHRFAGFAVLKAPDVPSVLVELGYLSNASDRKMLLSDKFRKKIGQAILASLDEYFRHVDDLASR